MDSGKGVGIIRLEFILSILELKLGYIGYRRARKLGSPQLAAR